MTKIIQRHDTAANWTSVNPVLAAGEMGVEADTNKFKFGDGATAWNSLAYAAGEGGSGDSYTKTETDSLLSTKQDKLTAVAPLKIANGTYKELNVDIIRTDGTLSESFVYSPPSVAGSSSIYLKTTNTSIPFATSDTWEIVLRYVPSSTGNATLYAFSTSDFGVYTYNKKSIDLEIHSGNVNIATLVENIPSFANTLCYVKLEFTGTAYVLSHSLDGVEYTVLYSKNNSSKVITNSDIIFCNSNGSEFCTGDIYLTDSYYKINGVKYPLAVIEEGALTISNNPATTSSLGVVQPDGTSITVSETGVISGQDVKTFTGYSDTGTLVLKSINGVLQWVAE